MNFRNLLILSAMAMAILGAAGCAMTRDVLQSAGESYQCEREAANRPDEEQRRAECQFPQQRIANNRSPHES